MRTNLRAARLLTMVSVGVCFQFGGCFDFALTQLNQLNPCGPLINCDPTVFEFARSDVSPGVNDDPFCLLPPFCANDPLFGDLAP